MFNSDKGSISKIVKEFLEKSKKNIRSSIKKWAEDSKEQCVEVEAKEGLL